MSNSLEQAVAVLLSNVWLGGHENPDSKSVSSFMPPADTNIMKAMEELRTAYFARRVCECVEVGDVGNTDAIQVRCDELVSLVRNEVLPALDATGVNISLAADLRSLVNGGEDE